MHGIVLMLERQKTKHSEPTFYRTLLRHWLRRGTAVIYLLALGDLQSCLDHSDTLHADETSSAAAAYINNLRRHLVAVDPPPPSFYGRQILGGPDSNF